MLQCQTYSPKKSSLHCIDVFEELKIFESQKHICQQQLCVYTFFIFFKTFNKIVKQQSEVFCSTSQVF